ncbi:hypothetical protein HBI25_079570 [Parastagonospora nodorum]|nr:hypothetical protein HBH53_123340 [Parastagonospora nodorum]KAH3969545.1 hypothetical protein HBH52_171350 [Parastagonospora nodorum]KAH4186465.1 hypothetical protein HBH42_166410 [Parastagonospora nodorum]KAH4257988.1 hypothetical protein HBI03_149890 [Parastagonospora nodorum]KAH4277446.1 hypothetical protein HBI04_094550 [Parastagonospora nodorum]
MLALTTNTSSSSGETGLAHMQVVCVYEGLPLQRHTLANKRFTVFADKEKASGNGELPSRDFLQPRLEDGTGVELLLKHAALSLEFLTLRVKRPVLAQNVFNLAHVVFELGFDLASPYNRAGHGREIAKLRHRVRLRVAVLALEALVESRNVLLDILYELRLVLRDSSSDLGPHEERVELGEDAEHLAGGLGSSQTISESRNDRVLDTRGALVVLLLSLLKQPRTLCGNIEHVDILENVIGFLDFLDSINVANLLDDDSLLALRAIRQRRL